MHLVVTRSYPPEIGGMQNLMWGLTNSLSKHDLIKVFADDHENASQFDESVSFTIERIGGPKIIKKYRKSLLVNNYLETNNKVKSEVKTSIDFQSPHFNKMNEFAHVRFKTRELLL